MAANDPGSKRDVDHDQRSPDERELAAMAEQASAILQKNPQSTEPAPESEPAGVASTVSDVTEPRAPIMLTDPHGDTLDSEDTEGAEDHIDLPLERTVKAFVSTISPSIVADGKPGNNGESLELAFDQFVTEARALSTALPRPIVDDRQLAQLARIPAPEPAPVRPEPMAEPLPAPVALMPTAPEPPRRSVVPALVGGLLIGGLAVFAAVKLGVIPSTSVDATTQGFTPTTATRLDTGTPASASAGEVDQAAVTAASEDDAAVVAQPDQATATAATADTDTDTDTDADADADADADPAAATAVASPDARTAAAAVTPAGAKKARRTRAHQRPGPRKAAARQPRQPRPKTATPKAPKAKRSSDWVDPFSQ